MLLLSEILPTEPFIIAGTSLNEIDLEYYLSGRTPATPRKARGPSLLIEPSPDAAARADCKRYDLILVPVAFGEFLEWVAKTFPNPPSVRGLTVPTIDHLFRANIAPAKLLRFFSDFELVSGANQPKPNTPSPFMYGVEPTWREIEQHLDVERKENQALLAWAQTWLKRPDPKRRAAVVFEQPATGKSTLARRVGHDLASFGKVVFSVRTLSRIDSETARGCLAQLAGPAVLLVDGLAEHAEQINELLDDNDLDSLVAVIGCERHYRKELVDIVLSEHALVTQPLGQPSDNELEQLLEQYRAFGLLAAPTYSANKANFLRTLRGDPLAVAVCRILNDFRPIDRIVDSVWQAADEAQRKLYLACALAQRCHTTGVRYSVLQAVGGPHVELGKMIRHVCPLPLALNPVDEDFVIPQSAVIAERLLSKVTKTNRDLLLAAFVGLAEKIASRVNRRAIRLRSPEARLAGRLFDSDKIVKPLLEQDAERFYIAVKPSWEWNSRYWEQRALLLIDRDIRTSVQYARHAVSIEAGPFALTTLGKVLLRSGESATQEERARLFDEAFSILNQAIEMEAQNARVTIHPFSALLTGTAKYLEQGGRLSLTQHDKIAKHVAEVRYRFKADPGTAAAVSRCDAVL